MTDFDHGSSKSNIMCSNVIFPRSQIQTMNSYKYAVRLGTAINGLQVDNLLLRKYKKYTVII